MREPSTTVDQGLAGRVAALDASPAFDVVALTGSAGGIAAVMAVLRELPAWFPVPLVVMLHLPPESTLVNMFRHLPFKAEWVGPGSVLAPGRLLLCPPRAFVEVLPDGSCVVAPCERGAVDKPINRFLDSLARSFGNRALGVVLTGMGEDAAAGARELHRAGGCVLVQSEATAEYPSMPAAAIAAGAADMVLPLAEIGPVIGELAAGTPRSQMRPEIEAISRTFGDRGEVASRALGVDWGRTPLGPVMGWPPELRLMVRTALESPYPTAVWWGPQLIQLYNDAWCGFLGRTKHPRALGGRARETWPEIWHDIGPMVERVMSRGEVAGDEDYQMHIDRHGYLEEVFASFSYSPIRDAAGAVLGVFNTAYETTKNVVAERRMRALRTLSAQIAGADTPREACVHAAAALATDPLDVPLALLYLLDKSRRQATLAGAAGVEPGTAAAPHVVALADDNAPWPLSRAVPKMAAAAGGAVLLDDLAQQCPQLVLPPAAPAGTTAPHAAFLLPLRAVRDETPMGVLVLALSPHRPLDDSYRSFVDLVGAQIAAGLAQARAKQLERERLERLAELDQAKTQFFANVSHEFRTPLTLLLAPLEEALRQREALPAPLVEDLDVAARNARRLLTLVTNLLDFSQIESRRRRATLVPVDLGALTADIASHFRSAIEAAGLRLRVDCDPALPPVPIDAEMWTKIVSNLLSNAFKFTFEGEIRVTLRALWLHAELMVADTGIGITPQEQPQVFQRFHRVRGARSRTAEGAGIGLSIVQDLVSRMGGQLTLRSAEDQGSSFTIWMPFKSSRLVAEPATGEVVAPTSGLAADFAEQALRWLPDALAEPDGVLDDLLGPPPALAGAPAAAVARGRIVVIDDNADMRDYLRRLLSARWNVEVAAEGEAGLAAARRLRPEAILADVMMPGLDGFEVVKRVRDDPALRHTPIVLVTARAGEASAIEGLMAGADDYIAKPFSPRELVARVRTVVERARADAALRRSEERQVFLLKLSDAIRPLGHPEAVKAAASRVLGEQLCAQRVFYAEVAGDDWVVEGRYERGVAPVAPGRYPASVYGPHMMEAFRAGRRVVYRDMHHEAGFTSAEREAHLALEIVAAVGVPLVKEGRLTAVLVAQTAQPRDWSEDEMVLVEETAERTWAAVERARTEAALRQSEERYRALFESMDEAYAVVELLKNEHGAWADFRFLEVNPAFMQHTSMPYPVGKTATQLLGTPNPYWAQVYGQVLDTGTPVRVEQVEPMVGRTFDLNIFALDRPRQRVAVLFTNITQRKAAEAALRESEARARTLVEGLAQATWETSAKGEVVTDSPSWRAYTGQSHEQWLGYGWVDAIHPDDRGYAQRQWREAVAARRNVNAEFRLRHAASGGYRWTNVRAVPLLADDGTIQKWVGMNIDIDDRKQAEAALHLGEERQAFLLKLSDALQPLSDSVAIQREAARVLGEYLGATRVMVGEMSDEETHMVIGGSFVAGAVPVLAERDRRDDFGPSLLRKLEAGHMVTVADVASAAELTADERAACAALGIAALAGVPLVKRGRLAASLSVHYPSPHPCPPEERALIREAAERTWAAVERARAEAALRASEARYRTLIDSIDEGFVIAELIHDAQGRLVDALYIEGNPAASRLTGIPDFNRHSINELMPGAEAYWLEIYDRVACTGVAERLERYAAPLGRWYDFHVSRVAQADDTHGGGAPGDQTRLAIVFQEITARRQAEDALRRSEEAARQAQERQAFLLQFGDSLRAQPDESSIKGQTVELLAAHLHLDRCWVSEVFESQGRSTVGPEHLRPDLAPMSGEFRLSDFPQTMLQLATQPMVVHDAASDARFPDAEKALLAGLRLQALLVAPLRKGERHVICALAAAMATPRAWSEGERVLLEEVAERMWAAVERARGMAAAARAQRHAQALIERMGDAHCVLDREFRIQAVNAATERVLGVPRAALIGHSHWDIFPASVDAPVGRAFKRVVAEGIEQHLTHHYTGEGYDLHIELDAYPTDEGGVAMFWRDVTERVQAEAALRQSEEKYRALFNKMDEAYAVVEILKDERGGWADFRFVEVNPAFMEHTSMPYPVGKTATQLLGTPDPAWARIYGQVLDSGQPIRTEQSEATLGRVFDLNIFVLETGQNQIAVLFANITQRKAAEAALQQSEERLRLAANVGELATWDWDLCTGRVAWSDAHFRMQGYTVGEVEPSYQAWVSRVHPQDRAPTEAALQCAREQRLPYAHEFRSVHPDGEVHWLSAQGCYFYDAGEAVRMIGVMRDVTEQRRARELLEHRVAERTQALRQLLQRLETVQDDERRRIARELHDGLGQYLSSVTLALGSLRGAPHDAAAPDRVRQLHDLAQQLERELDRIVFLLRPTALEDGGLGEGVAAHAQTWSELTGVAVDLELHGLDRARLEPAVDAAVFRVVQEALDNVARHARALRVSVSLERRRDQLVGSIEDDGIGFEPADATVSPAAGIGWGLVGMRERIEALGGQLLVESQPGRGTTVLLRVPLDRRQEP